MKAFAITSPEKPASLVNLPEPAVGGRDVLIAIRAASVNGFDVFQASGYLLGRKPHTRPQWTLSRRGAQIRQRVRPASYDEAWGRPRKNPLECDEGG